MTDSNVYRGTMLILKGIHSLLHAQWPLKYAEVYGYKGEVLDASGEAYDNSPQVKAALARVANGDVSAIYGFSGGGYNAVHIWDHMTEEQRAKITRVVIVGSPGVEAKHFTNVQDVVVWNSPNAAHMDQPKALYESLNVPSGNTNNEVA